MVNLENGWLVTNQNLRLKKKWQNFEINFELSKDGRPLIWMGKFLVLTGKFLVLTGKFLVLTGKFLVLRWKFLCLDEEIFQYRRGHFLVSLLYMHYFALRRAKKGPLKCVVLRKTSHTLVGKNYSEICK